MEKVFRIKQQAPYKWNDKLKHIQVSLYWNKKENEILNQ